MANLLLKEDDSEKLQYSELDHFSRCLESLSIGAIHILGLTYKIAKTPGRKKTPEGDYTLAVRDVVPNAPPGMSPSLVMSLMAELNSWNMLEVSSGASFIRTTDKVGKHTYCGNIPIRFTSSAERFVEYVLGTQDSNLPP